MVCDVRETTYVQIVIDSQYPGNGRPGWSTAGDINGDHVEEGEGLVTTNSTLTGNDGQLAGPAWTTQAIGCSGYALDFDGLDDVLDIDAFDISGPGLTLSAWIRADDFDVGDARILSKSTDGIEVQDHFWMLSTDLQSGNYVLRFRLKTDGTTDTLIAGGNVLTTGIWTHVAAAYEGSNMILYQDGAEVGRVSKSGQVNSDASVPVAIGNQPGSPNKPFDGLIDEVQLYSRALSLVEIVKISNQGDACSPVLSEYETWVTGWLASHLIPGTAPEEDADLDGCLNLWEWLQGGNPTADDCRMLQPWSEFQSGGLNYYYRKVVFGLVYQVEGLTNLMDSAWEPIVAPEEGGVSDIYWRTLPMDVHIREYFRMKVGEPTP